MAGGGNNSWIIPALTVAAGIAAIAATGGAATPAVAAMAPELIGAGGIGAMGLGATEGAALGAGALGAGAGTGAGLALDAGPMASFVGGTTVPAGMSAAGAEGASIIPALGGAEGTLPTAFEGGNFTLSGAEPSVWSSGEFGFGGGGIQGPLPSTSGATLGEPPPAPWYNKLLDKDTLQKGLLLSAMGSMTGNMFKSSEPTMPPPAAVAPNVGGSRGNASNPTALAQLQFLQQLAASRQRQRGMF